MRKVGEKPVVCIKCPLGCRGKVTMRPDGKMILKGYNCKEGRSYIRVEAVRSLRILTATVAVENGSRPLLPVKTDRPVPGESLKACMKALAGISIRPPVKTGQVIVVDLSGTGANLVATMALRA